MTNTPSHPEPREHTTRSATSGGPGRGRKRKSRNLVDALTLRPREVFEVYGMPVTTVSDLCEHPDPDMRIPSYKVPGRQGRKGSRYIDHGAFKKWLGRWRCEGGAP